MLSRRSTKLDEIFAAYAGKDTFGSGEETMLCQEVLWPNPFAFQDSSHSLGYVEMRGIWRQIEDIETSLLPFFKTSFHFLAFMDACIINDQEGGLVECEGEFLHIISLLSTKNGWS